MKRIAVVFAVAFVLALALNSCNNEVCPAYSQADADIENIG